MNKQEQDRLLSDQELLSEFSNYCRLAGKQLNQELFELKEKLRLWSIACDEKFQAFLKTRDFNSQEYIDWKKTDLTGDLIVSLIVHYELCRILVGLSIKEKINQEVFLAWQSRKEYFSKLKKSSPSSYKKISHFSMKSERLKKFMEIVSSQVKSSQSRI